MAALRDGLGKPLDGARIGKADGGALQLETMQIQFDSRGLRGFHALRLDPIRRKVPESSLCNHAPPPAIAFTLPYPVSFGVMLMGTTVFAPILRNAAQPKHAGHSPDCRDSQDPTHACSLASDACARAGRRPSSNISVWDSADADGISVGMLRSGASPWPFLHAKRFCMKHRQRDRAWQ